jgi:hypothetical protein
VAEPLTVYLMFCLLNFRDCSGYLNQDIPVNSGLQLMLMYTQSAKLFHYTMIPMLQSLGISTIKQSLFIDTLPVCLY